MKMSFLLLLLLCLIAFSSCGPVTPVIHEGNNQENYKGIFNEDVPPDVEVINSLYVTYDPSFRPMVITTPDFEIELVATKQWIEKKVKKFWLRKFPDTDPSVKLVVERRVKERGREWYVPKDISQYEIYVDASSATYLQMLVDKTTIGENRYRVFMSKH
jgi:hypothetical protein